MAITGLMVHRSQRIGKGHYLAIHEEALVLLPFHDRDAFGGIARHELPANGDSSTEAKTAIERWRSTVVDEVARAIRIAGVDPALVDPRRVLAGIATDASASANAWVAACKTLLSELKHRSRFPNRSSPT